MPYTTTEVLDIAEICQFLAKNDEVKGNLFRGGYERIGLSRLIFMVRDAVQWLFDYNPSSSSLLGQTNFLFSLCQPFVGQALQIIGSGGSGTIVNPATGVISTIIAQTIEFVVGDVGAPILNGQTSMVLNYTSVLSSSVYISLDGVDLPVGVSDRISFNVIYISNNITITFNQAVITGQLYSVRFLQYIAI
jgi:hypothetical protein